MLREALKLIGRTIAAIAIILLVHLLGACSAAPRKAPSFVAMRGNIQSARADATAARAAIERAQKLAPKNIPDLSAALSEAHSRIDSLTEQLLGADTRAADLGALPAAAFAFVWFKL